MRVFQVYDLPEDKSEHEASVMAMDMFCALHDIDEMLRRDIKSGLLNTQASNMANIVRARIAELPLDRIE
jgi:hypothetical protein